MYIGHSQLTTAFCTHHTIITHGVNRIFVELMKSTKNAHYTHTLNRFRTQNERRQV
jgi:hypothetical protein